MERQGEHNSQRMRTCLPACARTIVCRRVWRGKGSGEIRQLNANYISYKFNFRFICETNLGIYLFVLQMEDTSPSTDVNSSSSHRQQFTAEDLDHVLYDRNPVKVVHVYDINESRADCSGEK